MRKNRIFRTLALVVVFALLVILIPVSPALAADEDITLDPDEGEIGSRFYVEGQDFTPSNTSDANPDNWTISEVDIYFSSDEADVNDDIDDEVTIYERLERNEEVDDDGDFTKRVTVPDELTDGDDSEDVERGTYYVYVTYEGRDNIEAVAEFTVIAAAIEIDINDGPVGTDVEITGVDFGSREDITVEYDGVALYIESGDTDTDRDGDFQSTIVIPESTAGDHTITVEGDESGTALDAVFTVEPEMTIDSTSGTAGDRVTVSGTGFGGRVDVTVTFNGNQVATDSTSRDGSFTIRFDVPGVGSGTYDVEARDADNNSGTAEFTMAASASISKTSGNIGEEITISGTGFEPNTTVTITYTSEPIVVATTTADSNGSFSVTFTVPQSEHGDHTITATDGTNTMEFTFAMESTAPLIPTPLLPEMGIKAKQPVHFDWKDVTDPSLPVTYVLQIAKDQDFTDIVLEDTGLTQSEYTIPKERELESTKKEAPYWWRIKAIDGASNESTWSDAGSFYVGFILTMPNWAIYTLFGLGALLLGILGFWLGRRTAYY